MNYTSFPGGAPVSDRRWDAAAGFESALNTIQQQRAQEHALQEMILQNQKRGLENTRYARENPSKFAQFDLERMISEAKMQEPGYGRQMALGSMGEAQQQQAKGMYQMGTVDTEIPRGNAQNNFAMAKSVLERIELMTPAMQQGGMQGNMIYNQLRQSLPPGMQNTLPPMFGPEAMHALDKIRQGLVQSVPHEQQMQEIDNRGGWDLARQGLANEGQIATARTRAGAKVRSLMEEFNRAKNAEKLTLGTMILASDEVDDATKQQVRAAMQMAARAESERLGRGNVDINNLRDPGAIPDAINRRLGGGQQTPQPTQQYQQGQIYRGRTGAYEYLGGDPANPKSWKKAQ